MPSNFRTAARDGSYEIHFADGSIDRCVVSGYQHNRELQLILKGMNFPAGPGYDGVSVKSSDIISANAAHGSTTQRLVWRALQRLGAPQNVIDAVADYGRNHQLAVSPGAFILAKTHHSRAAEIEWNSIVVPVGAQAPVWNVAPPNSTLGTLCTVVATDEPYPTPTTTDAAARTYAASLPARAVVPATPDAPVIVPPGVTAEAVVTPGMPWGTVAGIAGAIVFVAFLGVSLRRSHGTAASMSGRPAIVPPAPVANLAARRAELAAARRSVRRIAA